MDTLDMPTASTLRSQPIRTGSTAKRRWLRFVCLTGAKSLTQWGKLNSDALFLMEVKDEGTHPKHIRTTGAEHPTPSDRLHARDLQLCSDPKLLLSSWTYPSYFISTTYSILLQKSLVCTVDSSCGAKGFARWARHSVVFLRWLEINSIGNDVIYGRHWFSPPLVVLDHRWLRWLLGLTLSLSKSMTLSVQ